VRLLLDAHLSWCQVGKRLEAKGHDVRALDQEPEYDGLPDRVVIALAAEDDRILVTADVGDFPHLLRVWAASERPHAGAILIYGVGTWEFDLIVRGVARMLAMHADPESWTNVTMSVDRAFATEGSEQ
jgi:predicted nuclease of predicted toxin-antitoxin system